MCDRHEDKGFTGGLLIGAIIGAAAVFLLGTEEGKKVQKEIKKKTEEVIDNLPEVVEELEEKAQEVGEKAQEVGTKVTRQVGEFQQKAQEVIGQKIEEVEPQINQIQSDAQTFGRRFFKGIKKFT